MSMTPRYVKTRSAIATRLAGNLVRRGLPATTSRPRKSRKKPLPEALLKYLVPAEEGRA